MENPKELKYSADHEWVRVEGDVATIGITHYAQDQLGDIVYVEVETVGETLEKDTVFGTVEAVKTVSELFIPVSGTVTQLNEALESKPELINEDPYGDGWIVKVEIQDKAELDSLITETILHKICMVIMGKFCIIYFTNPICPAKQL